MVLVSADSMGRSPVGFRYGVGPPLRFLISSLPVWWPPHSRVHDFLVAGVRPQRAADIAVSGAAPPRRVAVAAQRSSAFRARWLTRHFSFPSLVEASVYYAAGTVAYWLQFPEVQRR